MDFVPLLLHPIVVQLVEYNVFRSPIGPRARYRPSMGSGNQGTFPVPVFC